MRYLAAVMMRKSRVAVIGVDTYASMPLGAGCSWVTLYEEANGSFFDRWVRGITAALMVSSDQGRWALAQRIFEDSEHEDRERLLPPGHPAAGPYRR
jgi:hypothetical protein